MYCLDTNIFSYLASGKYPKLDEKINQVGFDKICTTVITQNELFFGCYNNPNKTDKLLKIYKNYLSIIPVLSLENNISEIFAKIKYKLKTKGIIIGDSDLLIGCICLSKNMTLITNNTKHFSQIDGLKLEDWTK